MDDPDSTVPSPSAQPPYGEADEAVWRTAPLRGNDGDVPPPPRGRAPRRAPLRGSAAVLVLAASLLSGAIGAVVTRSFDAHAATTTAVAAPPAATTTQTAAAVVPGSAEAAARSIAPSVVTIAFSGTASVASVFGTQQQQVSGTGSGIVLDTAGDVLTNNHVVADAQGGGSLSVTFSDGTTRPASIVGTDPSNDIAVIHVKGAGQLKPAVFADSNALQVGQAVLAVGAPLGLSNTVTEGIVSTLHRPVRTGAPTDAQAVIDAIQTDAAINPGNSGGALVDLSGRVVGINSAIATTGGQGSGSIGVGFAIPSDDATAIAKQLMATGHAVHPQLGVGVADAVGQSASSPGLGATVQSVTSGGPAAGAGLLVGDVLTAVDGRQVTTADGLIVAVRSHQPGSVVTLTYQRGGTARTVKATLSTAR